MASKTCKKEWVCRVLCFCTAPVLKRREHRNEVTSRALMRPSVCTTHTRETGTACWSCLKQLKPAISNSRANGK